MEKPTGVTRSAFSVYYLSLMATLFEIVGDFWFISTCIVVAMCAGLLYLVFNRESLLVRSVGTLLSFVVATLIEYKFGEILSELGIIPMGRIVLFMPFMVGLCTVLFFPKEHRRASEL